MLKKIFCFLLAATMLFSVVGCSNSDPTVNVVSGQEPPVSSEPEAPTTCVNPLTGLNDLPLDKANARPFAIMVNNIDIAQSVQTGVQKADIVYETEVEGGVTRLLAVFKDVEDLAQIGTVRSARYAYIDLALGHDAVYVHCGIDPLYAAPHVQNSGVADFNINSYPWAPYGFRESNGLAYEHTMYTSGELLLKGVNDLSIRSTTEENTWCDFNDPDIPVAPAGESADKITVKFSNYATSIFEYDSSTRLYTKNTKGLSNKDVKTGEGYAFTNVFVLSTGIYYYSDNYHRKVELNGGQGWYASNGSYKEIVWKKAGENQPIMFYNADGTPLKVNAGKSYICIQNSNFTPTFEAYAAQDGTVTQ